MARYFFETLSRSLQAFERKDAASSLLAKTMTPEVYGRESLVSFDQFCAEIYEAEE